VGNTELMSKTGRASRLNTQGTIEELGAVAPAEWRQRMGVQAQTKKKIKSLLTRPTFVRDVPNVPKMAVEEAKQGVA
jgi:hypothetical protein